MKHALLLIIVLCFALPVAAQKTRVAQQHGTGAPAASICTPGVEYVDDATGNLYTFKTGTGCILSGNTAAGGGDVVGPGSATDNAIVRFDSTTGKLTQNSLATIDDSGSVNIPTGQTYKINSVALGKSDVGLSAVTNDAQTKAAVVPNTLPSAGQVLAGNAGGTAYAPVSVGGDATVGSTGTLTLATVNSNVGIFGSATQVPQFTANGKGLVTAVANVTITPAVGSITGFGTGVATALAVNVGAAGAFVVNGGALGSPSSAGTLPAHTLGGTISGGGNQINNVIIGTSTPLAGTFTTLVGTTVNGLTITNNGTNTLSITAGKTLTVLKTISLTAADDTGVYTLPTGTKTLLATDGAGTSLTGIPYTLTGTANQVVLSAGTGNITFSTPQSIGTASTPQFARIGLGLAANANVGLISNTNIAVTATNSVRTFGVGVPGDADSEYIDMFHNGAGGAFLLATKSGTGSYRSLDIRTGGSQTMLLGTDQSVTFPGAIKNTGITSDATHTDSTVCQDTTTHQFYSGSGTVGICLGTSSARFKNNIMPLGVGLNAIMALQPVSYQLKTDPQKTLYGFTAEQGGVALPMLMGRDIQGRPNTFDYLGVVPVLVRAIQEQQQEIDELKARVKP